MRLLDLTLPDPAADLALDEALLLAAEDGSGGAVLRLWERPGFAVVVGAAGSVAVDVDVDACRADEVPVLRRSSGGGTVLLGPGCLCYSVVLPYAHAPGLDQIQPSIRYVLGRVRDALGDLIPAATVEGVSDLATDGVKFSGNAQQRKRTHFLHHGTLLADAFDLAAVPRYLRPPEREPAYRAGRPHAAFVRTLPTTTAELKRRLVVGWGAGGEYGPVPLDRVRELVAEKYGRDEWVRRR